MKIIYSDHRCRFVLQKPADWDLHQVSVADLQFDLSDTVILVENKIKSTYLLNSVLHLHDVRVIIVGLLDKMKVKNALKSMLKRFLSNVR